MPATHWEGKPEGEGGEGGTLRGLVCLSGCFRQGGSGRRACFAQGMDFRAFFLPFATRQNKKRTADLGGNTFSGGIEVVQRSTKTAGFLQKREGVPLPSASAGQRNKPVARALSAPACRAGAEMFTGFCNTSTRPIAKVLPSPARRAEEDLFSDFCDTSTSPRKRAEASWSGR